MQKPEFNTFVPQFVNALFTDTEVIRYAKDTPGLSRKLLKSDVLSELLGRHAPPNMHIHPPTNVWFSPSVFDNTPDGIKAENCLHTRAICMDLDYKSEAHPNAKFESYNDAYAYVLTLPITPTGIWSTGHGIQIIFLLREPFDLRTVVDGRTGLDIFKDVTGKLAKIARADTGNGPEHLYRVPITYNQKKDTPCVLGELLSWNPDVVYTFQDIYTLCSRYDIPEPETQIVLPDTIGINVSYDQLPDYLREQIEKEYPVSERSDALFRIISGMIKAGYPDAVINTAVHRNRSIANRFSSPCAFHYSAHQNGPTCAQLNGATL